MDLKEMDLKEINKLLSEGLQLSKSEKYQLADRLVEEIDRISWLDEHPPDYGTLSSLMENVEPEFTETAQMKLNRYDTDITLTRNTSFVDDARTWGYIPVQDLPEVTIEHTEVTDNSIKFKLTVHDHSRREGITRPLDTPDGTPAKNTQSPEKTR